MPLNSGPLSCFDDSGEPNIENNRSNWLITPAVYVHFITSSSENLEHRLVILSKASLVADGQKNLALYVYVRSF